MMDYEGANLLPGENSVNNHNSANSPKPLDKECKFCSVSAAAVLGVKGILVSIECVAGRGASFTLVGLPDAAVKESHQRIIAAIQQSGMHYPIGRYTINMAPADVKKEGAAYDLPIAVAMLMSLGVVDVPQTTMIMGELSLDGTIRPIKGVLPMAVLAAKEGFQNLVVPYANAREAAVVEGIRVYGAKTLKSVIDFFKGQENALEHFVPGDFYQTMHAELSEADLDFADVKGQESVKRALEIAAAGMHNILMIGPPGSGKSMMAKRVSTILPPLTLEESLETTMVHSVAGELGTDTSLLYQRPFRAPHHSLSAVAMVGGGSTPKPGEISLCHNGVLFLDELPEFPRVVLEVLRQPLEDRVITVSRAKMSVTYPASFMLVASMNPCPCGHYNNPQKKCKCLPHQVLSYLGRISGPLLDRIDIQCEIIPVPFEALSSKQKGEPSSAIRERVLKARAMQRERFAREPHIYANAQMTPAMLQRYVRVDKQGLDCLKMAMEKFALSARAYDRILKVSRTIADLAGSPEVLVQHVAEAVGYRKLDRDSWGQPL